MNTPGLGTEYEVHIPAYFALKLFINKDVEDFTLQSNAQDFGNLDDVLLVVKLKSGRYHRFAIQLKHKDVKKNKKLYPLNFTSGKDFNLKNYCNSFTQLSRKKQRYKFVLYSNIQFDDRKKTEVTEFKMVSVPHKNNHFDIFVFDESEDFKGIYKFKVNENDNRQDFKRFFSRFSLLVRQKNEKSVEDGIIKIFKDEFNVEQNVAINYIALFRKWHKGNFLNKKLDKKTLSIHLVHLLLSPFILDPPFIENDKMELFVDAVNLFDVTVIDHKKENFEKDFGKNNVLLLTSYNNRDLQLYKRRYGIKTISGQQGVSTCLFRIGKEMKLIDKYSKTLTPQDERNIYSYLLGSPLFVDYNDASKEIVYKAAQIKHYAIKLVLVGQNIDMGKISQLKVFHNLEDLSKVNNNLFSEVIQQCKISIQGRTETQLQQLINFHQEVTKLIQVKELVTMLNGILSIGEASDDLPKTYVTRSVSVTYLNLGKVLDHVLRTNDVLIINCRGRNRYIKTVALRKGINTTVIDQFDESHYQEVILFENEDCTMKQFDEICKKTRRSVHVVKLIDENSLLLVISSHSTEELRKLSFEGPSVGETEIYSFFNHSVNFVCAQPGMGKSTLFKYLKNKCPHSFWTVSVNLREHNSFFRKQPTIDQVLDHFLQDRTNLDQMSGKLKKMFEEKMMIFFFFDGLDEIDCSSVHRVLDTIKELVSMGYCVWVSSRESLQKVIEDTLNVFPIMIEELTRNQQEYYIRTRLGTRYTTDEIEVIIQKVSTSCNVVNNSRILGVPLQLFILTEIFLNDRQQFEKLNEDILLLTKMYLNYFTGRWEHFKAKMESRCDIMPSYYLNFKLEKYEIPALQSCLGPDTVELPVSLPEDKEFLDCIKTNGDELGIITKFDDSNKPVFDHETYAEFFACRWLSKNLSCVRSLRHCLFSEKHQNLKLILDVMLAEDFPLHLAVIYKDVEQIEKHLLCGRYKDKGGRTPFHLACSHGISYPPLQSDKSWYRYDNDNVDQEKERSYKTVLEKLIRFGVSAKDTLFRWTPFRYAVASRCLVAIDVILGDHYYKTFDQTELRVIYEKIEEMYGHSNDVTVAHYSAKFGYDNLLRVVILDVPKNDNSYSLLLNLAAIGNHQGIVQQLIELQVDIDALDYNYETPLHLATRNGNLEIVDLLLRNGASINGSCQVAPALRYARSVEVFNFLLRQDADINYISYNKKTLLHYVAEEGNVVIAQLLIEQGLPVNAKDENGLTPLHVAADFAQYDIAKILLDNDADACVTTQKKRTGLHYASIKDNKEIMKLLVLKDVPLDAKDTSGATALHLAVEFRCVNAIEYLLSVGANPNTTTKSGENTLHYAAVEGNVKIVEMLISSGVDINAQDQEEKTALHLVTQNRHYQAMMILFQKNANLNLTTRNKQTVLHHAARGGNVQIIEFLLQQGLEVDAVDKDGTSALHLAVKWQHPDAVRFLLDRGACVNAATQQNETPLHLAARNGNMEIITLLCQRGAEINAQLTYSLNPLSLVYNRVLAKNGRPVQMNEQLTNGVSPLHVAVKFRRLFAMDFLLAHGAHVNALTDKSETPLHYAAVEGITEIVKLLLEKGAQVNAQNEDGATPLHLAIQDGYYNVFQLLVNNGADVNIITDKNRTTLYYAAARSYHEMVKLLLDKGVPVNTADVDGITALHISAATHNYTTTLYLLSNGAQIKALTKKKQSTLHYAVKGRNMGTVTLLLENGVDVNLQDEDGASALHLALGDGSYDIAKLLVDSGANTKALTQNGETVIHLAAKGGDWRVVEWLLGKEDIINQTDNDGVTPLHVAVECEKYSVVKLLLKKGAQAKVMTKCGHTPLQYALRTGNIQIELLLLRNFLNGTANE